MRICLDIDYILNIRKNNLRRPKLALLSRILQAITKLLEDSSCLISRVMLDDATVLPRHQKTHFVNPGCLVYYKWTKYAKQAE